MTLTQGSFARSAFAIVCAASLGCAYGRAQQAQHIPRFDFKGKLLVVACDTDMVPSAYVDGKLGPAVGPDVLSVIRLDRPVTQMSASTVPVTNSVTAPPAAVAVTPDGRYVIVAETEGPRPAGKADATMKDLAPGKKITVVDLVNPDKPKVVQQLESYLRAVSVSVNASGTLVAVAFASKSHAKVPLVIYRFREGKLSAPSEPELSGYTATDKLSDAEFLPGKDVLGVLYASAAAPRLSLLQDADIDGRVTLSPWGDAIAVDASPYVVKFSPDGRFALVNSMHEFADERGTVTSIQLAAARDAQGNPQHSIVSRAEAGKFPEGLAISPDGRWIATANLENSYLPLSNRDEWS